MTTEVQGDTNRRKSRGITDGSIHVNPLPGTGNPLLRRSLLSVTTREKVEWPAGSNIREVWAFCKLAAAPASMQAVAHVCGMIAIDATSDGAADTALLRGDSATADALFDDIPLNTWVRLPQTAALSQGSLGGGRADVKASDEITSLTWLLLGQ